MKPKNMPQTIGLYSFNKKLIKLENRKIPNTIPKIRVIKKHTLWYLKNSFGDKISSRDLIPKEAIELMRIGYIPVMKATVPPEIPGTISATPIKVPRQKTPNLEIRTKSQSPLAKERT